MEKKKCIFEYPILDIFATNNEMETNLLVASIGKDDRLGLGEGMDEEY